MDENTIQLCASSYPGYQITSNVHDDKQNIKYSITYENLPRQMVRVCIRFNVKGNKHAKLYYNINYNNNQTKGISILNFNIIETNEDIERQYQDLLL